MICEGDSMAEILDCTLKLITEGTKVTVNVKYIARFSPLEMFFYENGARFFEAINIVGMDSSDVLSGNFKVLAYFPTTELPVLEAINSSTRRLNRDRTMVVDRAKLQEDTNLGDEDEIRCRITISPLYLPAEATAWTNQEILLG